MIGGTLRVRVTGLPSAPADTTALEIPVSTADLDVRDVGGAWRLTVPFVKATAEFLRRTNQFRTGLDLVEVEFAPFVANDEWAIPPGGLDEEAIVEPGTFSNVEGGFGFVGGGYEAPVRWIPSASAQFQAGFSVSSDLASLVWVNEIGSGYVELYNPTVESIGVGGYVVRASDVDGTTTGTVTIPNPTDIPAGGYVTVNGPFAPTLGADVALSSPSGTQLSRRFVDEQVQPGQSFGSYPDGTSFPLPQNGGDYFTAPLAPTPGQSNRPAVVAAVINEIETTGATGFVEAFPLLADVVSLRAFSRPSAFSGAPGLFGSPFPVASEGGSLDLLQEGGTVYLLATVQTGKQPPVTNVTDVRVYGPQTPGLSSGYLPDGPGGQWTTGLTPTRGLPNSAARLAGR